MDSKPAEQFLHQLLRHRYIHLLQTIVDKFQPSSDKKERLEALITCEFIAAALGKEDT